MHSPEYLWVFNDIDAMMADAKIRSDGSTLLLHESRRCQNRQPLLRGEVALEKMR